MGKGTLTSAAEITQMLQAWSAGDKQNLDRLLIAVYDEIHAIAARLFARQPADHTWQATALTNELYLELTKGVDIQFASRQHFFAFAGRKMRQLLINKAEHRQAAKRGGGQAKLSITNLENVDSSFDIKVDLLDLEQSLNLLEIEDEDLMRIVELRFFLGLSVPEVAKTLDMNERTVYRHWAWAKAFIYSELKGGVVE